MGAALRRARRRPLAGLLIAVAVLSSPAAAAAPVVGRAPAGGTAAPGPSGAGRPGHRAVCGLEVAGSEVTVRCHNPFPVTDRVRLHVECERWWDLDVDTAPVETGPARATRLSARCWKEPGRAWVTHEVSR
ncbi:hypothetical protein [Streptomyces zingiberis]|uniref:Secreted protein n=1 Tax=Streptomyces zingiberis TaxID=2053010 RepID=A0ABX1C0C2_9ACTN|nr:hypothetical protein [Streptomyces zingiberis]NJQ02083.1 hypothetical protein [Streptomyces zingiberis]